jgi:hypothetical protein
VSTSNGVVRIARKGLKKFAFGDDGPPFEVDVVVAFQEWITIDEQFRPAEPDTDGNRLILTEQMAAYHQAAVNFVNRLTGVDMRAGTPNTVTTAEALDFIARLRECYDDYAVFFRPKSRKERGLLATSEGASSDTSQETEMRFSTEPD